MDILFRAPAPPDHKNAHCDYIGESVRIGGIAPWRAQILYGAPSEGCGHHGERECMIRNIHVRKNNSGQIKDGGSPRMSTKRLEIDEGEQKMRKGGCGKQSRAHLNDIPGRGDGS